MNKPVHRRGLCREGCRPFWRRWTRYGLLVLLILSAATCARGRRDADPSAYVPCIWPTPHAARSITSNFGYRNDPFSDQRRFHTGIDIAAPRKSRVVATAYGRVSYTGRDRGGYGKHVIIDHANGYQTLYAHLARIETKSGKRVKRGQVIGKLGKTGRATRPHLHYEVRRNGKSVNPRPYLPQ